MRIRLIENLTKQTMPETLSDALDREGSADQKEICTPALLALDKNELTDLLEGNDVGIGDNDKHAFRKFCHKRVNNHQHLLPWKDVKLSEDPPHANW